MTRSTKLNLQTLGVLTTLLAAGTCFAQPTEVARPATHTGARANPLRDKFASTTPAGRARTTSAIEANRLATPAAVAQQVGVKGLAQMQAANIVITDVTGVELDTLVSAGAAVRTKLGAGHRKPVPTAARIAASERARAEFRRQGLGNFAGIELAVVDQPARTAELSGKEAKEAEVLAFAAGVVRANTDDDRRVHGGFVAGIIAVNDSNWIAARSSRGLAPDGAIVAPR